MHILPNTIVQFYLLGNILHIESFYGILLCYVFFQSAIFLRLIYVDMDSYSSFIFMSV